MLRILLVSATACEAFVTPVSAQQAAKPADLPAIVVEGKQNSEPAKKTAKRAGPAKVSLPKQKQLPAPPVTPTLSSAETQGADDAFIAGSIGPVNGFVALRSATGSKTNTPLIETPQSISVVTSDQVKEQGAQELGQALRYTSGVSVERYGNDTRGVFAQVRGFESQTDYFFRDGLRTRGTGTSSFATLDIYGAERIEVFKGPASVLYGQNGPGGFINYVSKRPTTQPLGEVEFFAGSHDNYGARFDLSGPVGSEGKLSYRLTGSARDSHTQVDFVEADRLFIAPSISWRPSSGTSLTLLTNYQRDDTGLSAQYLPAVGTVYPLEGRRIPTSRNIGEPGDHYDIEQYSLGYLLEHKFDETWTFRQNARYSRLETRNSALFLDGLLPDLNGIPTSEIVSRTLDYGTSKLNAYVADNQFQAKVATGSVKHTLLLGLETQYYNYEETGGFGFSPGFDIFNPVYGQPVQDGGLYKDEDSSLTQTGLYAQEQLRAGNLVVLLGGRYDWAKTDTVDPIQAKDVTIEDQAFTGRAGFVYLFDSGFAPYVSYSESFNPVLQTEADGTPFEPETGRQYEAGIKYQPRGLNAFITVAAFDLARQNVVQGDPLNAFQPIQIGEIVSKGVEAEASASLSESFDLRAAYTYLDVEITKSVQGTTGNTPYAVPRHQASLWAGYSLRHGSLTGLGIGGGVRYIGESFGDNDNTFKVPNVTLADAAINYDWYQYRLALNVSNVFDKDYVASCFNYDFGCFYGEARRYLATVRYRW